MLHTQLNTLKCLGYACGWGAKDPGCETGPDLLRSMDIIPRITSHHTGVQWKQMLRPIPKLERAGDRMAIISELNGRLASEVGEIVRDGHSFLVLGGDHSCAVGTWSGVSQALGPSEPFGLIWIDAHMDSHTPQTTQSGAIHGMPLACLLGAGDKRLTNIGFSGPKLHPAHVVLIGVRSYERGEAEFLATQGVKVVLMKEVVQRGLHTVLSEALHTIKAQCNWYGISIDLDGVDPLDAPGVGSPESNGIRADALLAALGLVKGDRHLLGLEIAELNPMHDIDRKTATLALHIAEGIYS